MLSFLKKIFGAKPAEKSAAPYKVETPEAKPAKEKKTTAGKTASSKSKTPRKPKASKVS